MVPVCSLVCALVLRSGASTATQKALIGSGAAGDMSSMVLGLTARGHTGGAWLGLRPRAGHLEPLSWVSITVEDIVRSLSLGVDVLAQLR